MERPEPAQDEDHGLSIVRKPSHAHRAEAAGQPVVATSAAMLSDYIAMGRALLQVRFVRFLLVGALNTVVGYGLFALGILMGLPSALALLVATVLGVLFNYFSTGRLVFSSRDLGRLWRFLLVYGCLYVVNVAALAKLEQLTLPALAAQALLLPVFVILAYVLNKHFVFRLPRTSP